MLVLLSPAKTQDFASDVTLPSGLETTVPRMLPRAQAVVDTLRALPTQERHRRLKLTPRLIDAADQALAAWSGRTASECGKRPAAFAYTGETYRGLAVREMNRLEIERLHRHVRILSAFYGVLRPLDCIEPYRLDFGTRLAVHDASSLYDFWRAEITAQLARDIAEIDATAVVNLASAEFARAVDAPALGVPFVTPEFRRREDGKLKNVTVFTKQARGAMARWIASQGVRSIEELHEFDEEGYRYEAAESSPDLPWFVRDA
ncbi:MAG: YaaA family protein [Spirochaetales bacterium]